MSDRKRSTEEPAHDILAAEEFGMGDSDPRLHHEPPHDVLAAEEFGMGDSDPRLHHEPAHDILAAEEFGVGAYDPGLHHHGPVGLPEDPSGIAEPHDVLAAEEFAMPAGRTGSVFGADVLQSAAGSWRGRMLGAAGALGAFMLLRRRRR